MEFLEKNVDWLLEKLRAREEKYFVLDCPGQVELYTHHDSVRNILQILEKNSFRVRSLLETL